MIAIDVETTGIDFWHGCLPFSLQACRDDGQLFYVEWPVDPFTRQPRIKSENLTWYLSLLWEEDIVGHNVKFDLFNIFKILEISDLDYSLEWCWEGIQDTLIASHALRNLWPHGLKDLRDIFLFVDNSKQLALQAAVNKARAICRSEKFQSIHGVWRIAEPGDPHWPGVKKSGPKSKSEDTGSWWMADTWLPKTIAVLAPEFLPRIKSENSTSHIHPWHTVLQDYALEDVETTMALWPLLRDALVSEGLWEVYERRMQLLEASYYSEEYGVTLHPEKLATETQRYAEAAVSQQQRAIAIAARNSQNKEINLNSGPQLQRLLFTDFKLPVLKKTETGQPSTDAEVLEKLSAAEATSPSAREFLTSLLSAKRNQKAADALTSYKDWAHESTEEVRRPGNGSSVSASFRPGDCLRVSVGDQRDLSRHRDRDRQRVVSPRRDQSGQLSTSHGRGGDLQRLSLHPHINITGTSFTRQSFSSPNLQNVGTGKEEEGADGEKVLEYQLRVCFGPQPGRLWLDVDYSNIELRIWAYSCGNKEFIRCFEQDYSVHLLIAQELHPELKRMSDDDAKETKSYKKTKNGNFAIIYGSSPFQADRTYGVSGAYDKISARFPEVRSFTQKLHRLVEAQGYIETLCGYRLYIPLDEPHKAVSGFVQGSAGDIIGFAMSDAHQWLCRRPELDIHLPLQVHDQLVFDCPANTNRQHLRSLLGLMESQGKRIGIPLPVSAKLCQTNWTEGTKFV